MIRRTVLAALALTVLGSAAPALAEGLTSETRNEGVCILGTNHSTGARDGICVWVPLAN